MRAIAARAVVGIVLSGIMLLGIVFSAGCAKQLAGQPAALPVASIDQALIADYFAASNASARDGADAQQKFVSRTKHPDAPRACDLHGLTLLLEPSLGTLRPDNEWRPPGSNEAPRGRVYVLAVTVTVQRDKNTLGKQVGSMHVVVLDAMAYGFAPCPS